MKTIATVDTVTWRVKSISLEAEFFEEEKFLGVFFDALNSSASIDILADGASIGGRPNTEGEE